MMNSTTDLDDWNWRRRARVSCRIGVLSLALRVAAAVPGAVAAGGDLALWDDPAFQKRFTASYGVLSGVEPEMSLEEQRFLKELLEVIKSSPAQAMDQLKAQITPNTSASLNFVLANVYYQEGRVDESIDEYRTAIERFPDFRRAHKNLGVLLVQKSQFEEGSKSLTRAIELGSEDGDAYGLLGFCHLKAEKYVSAESAYRRALLLDPATGDWKLGLARCLVAQEDHGEAIALFDELIQANPGEPTFWLFQADAFIKSGKPIRAAVNYEIVRTLDRADEKILTALGDIYLMEGHAGLAYDAYEAAFEKQPDQPVGNVLRMAELLVSRDADTEALELTRKVRAIRTEPLSPADEIKVLTLESQIALRSGRKEEAVKILESLIARDPLNGEVLLLLAEHYGESDQVARAEIFYERAAKIERIAADALVRHGQLLVKHERFQDAVPLLRKAQEVAPRENVAKYLEQVERIAQRIARQAS